MNDGELLELAAKAAGYFDVKDYCETRGIWVYLAPGYCRWWNPLTDDGDALRLAVVLGLDVWRGRWPSNERYVAAQRIWNSNDSTHYDDGVPLEPDPTAATRRAIVRAAAEIGRAAP